MDPLSTIASVIAVIQLSSEVVSYVSGAAGATNERIRLRNEVLGCESILQQLTDEVNNTEEGKKWMRRSRLSRLPTDHWDGFGLP
jgi:hypothetical protein